MVEKNIGRLRIKDCISHMGNEEKEFYQDHTATDYFYYIYNSNHFQESLNRLEGKDWNYIFEKIYLVTYKAMHEEKEHVALDGVLYLFSRLGVFLTKKGTPRYNEFYKLLQVSQAPFMEKHVNDDLLFGLELVMGSGDENDLDILLNQHKEASVFRNHRDYLYHEDSLARDGELSFGEITAINCFNRSYEREKKLVLKY